ncbi:hypothetical protein DFH08DRAFT_963483 [Mycena albidolilacea]|uniref:Uncharacterized protein n=1 Tax=Mycena albidolilacea TaxID=1033008 RepID=A0AAD6ZVT5_9AGAR|nr:hypothetical protein DFH08DRAFT_963483 [Mycena albidolilacea]
MVPLLDTSCPLGDSQAPVHVALAPRPSHACCMIQAPPYDRVCAALVAGLDHTLDSQCTYERVSLHLPLLSPSLVAPTLPHPSRHPFLSSFPISALIRSCFPSPLRVGPSRRSLPAHRTIAHPRRSTCCADVYPHECDAKPALHAPASAPCARSPLLFLPLSRLPHLFLTSYSPPALPLPAPYASPLPPLLPLHLFPYATGHTPPHHHSLPPLPSPSSDRNEQYTPIHTQSK